MHANASCFTIRIHVELRHLIATKARKENVGMADIIAASLAGVFGRPDLAEVPRAETGRKLGSPNKKGKKVK